MTYVYQRLNHLRIWCQKILPLVYDDSLSYYEVLAKLVAYLNKMTEQVNNNSEAINELTETVNTILDNMDGFEDRFENLTDELEAKFNELEQTITTNVETELEAKEQEITRLLNEAIAKVEDEVSDALGKLDELTEKVDTAIGSLDEYKEELKDTVEAQIAESERQTLIIINNRLDEVISQIVELQNVQAKDPTDEYIVKPLDEVLDNIWKGSKEYTDIIQINILVLINRINARIDELENKFEEYWNWAMKIHSVSVDEYRHLHLTVDTYKKYIVNSIPRGITVLEYQTVLKKYVNELNKNNYIYSQKSGRKVHVKKEIHLNTDLIRMSGAFTAKEFDTKGFRVWDIDGHTIKDLDWKSNKVLHKRAIPNV